jgi:hypothetical protein
MDSISGDWGRMSGSGIAKNCPWCSGAMTRPRNAARWPFLCGCGCSRCPLSRGSRRARIRACTLRAAAVSGSGWSAPPISSARYGPSSLPEIVASVRCGRIYPVNALEPVPIGLLLNPLANFFFRSLSDKIELRIRNCDCFQGCGYGQCRLDLCQVTAEPKPSVLVL